MDESKTGWCGKQQQFWQNLTELFHTYISWYWFIGVETISCTQGVCNRQINRKHVTLGTGGSNQVHWLFFFSFWSQAYSISIENTPVWILLSIYLAALVVLYKLCFVLPCSCWGKTDHVKTNTPEEREAILPINNHVVFNFLILSSDTKSITTGVVAVILVCSLHIIL